MSGKKGGDTIINKISASNLNDDNNTSIKPKMMMNGFVELVGHLIEHSVAIF